MVQPISAYRPAEQNSYSETEAARGFQRALGNAGTGRGQRTPPSAPSAEDPAATPGQGDTVRRQQIDAWVDHHSDASGGFLGFGETSAVDHVREALDGRTGELGRLSTDEQRYLLDKVLDRWRAGRGAGPGGAAELVRNLGGNRQLQGIVAERLAAEAARLMQRPAGNGSISDPHIQARAYALEAIQATSGPLERTPSDYGPLRQLMNSLGPEGAARFVQALDPAAAGAGYYGMSQLQQRVLAATNSGPQTPVTSAVVQTIFSETTPGALHALPALQSDMAKALAREWHPDNPAMQASEGRRLAAILATDQGQRLLFGSGSDGRIPLDARVNALAIVRTDSSINAATLTQTQDPWTNRAILGPIAQANAQQYLSMRGDAPQTLRGTDLDNVVGYAMGFPLTLPHDRSAAAAQSDAANGRFSYYAQGPGQQPVQAVVDQIRRLGGAEPRVTVLPIEFGSSAYGPVQLPLFRVQTAAGDRYVDNTGRSYASFDDWKAHNQLPPGAVIYPEQGHLSATSDGRVRLASGNTPNTPDTTWKQVKGVLNDVALVGGIIAGGAVILGTGGAATPIIAGIAVASGAWGVYSTGSELLDRYQHGQSIDPIHDGTARGLWLGLAANTAGMGAFASEAALARIASTEGRLTSTAAWTIGTAKTVANVTNGAAFINTGIDISANWGSMSAEQRAQSILSMGFWGVTMLAGARQARGPGDLFNPSAMTQALADAYQPPVTRTTTLGGSRVEIVMEPQTGRPIILAGEHASPADIQLHVNVARMMARNQGLQGQINALMGRAEPAPGTLAYSAKYEAVKLNQKVSDLQARLANPHLTPQQRAQLQGDIDTTNAYLDQQLTSLATVARSPGFASIAAPSDGRARAAQLPGLVDALETGPYAHKGYYFRIHQDPDLPPEIVRMQGYDRDHPRLAPFERNDGSWTVRPVADEPNRPVYASRVSGGAAPSVRLTEVLSPAERSELEAALARRQAASARYNAASDPATRNAEGQNVVVQSYLIGELGARGYVQAEFPSARPIYGGNGSRPGDFDQVYRQVLPNGGVRFIVVEAKGGNSPLRPRLVDTTLEMQGTPAYFEETAESMRAMGGDAGRVGGDLLRAYRVGRTSDGKPAEVVYLVVRTPISSQGTTSRVGTVTARQFELTEQHP